MQAGEPTAQTKYRAEREIASRLDAELLHALGKVLPLPSLADDEAFLRRVSLDLTGKLPGPEEIRAFLADRDLEKRAKQIDRLLDELGAIL